MAATIIRPECVNPAYLNAVNAFKFTTLSSINSSDDDLDAVVVEVAHKMMIAFCFESTPILSNTLYKQVSDLNPKRQVAYRRLAFLEICLFIVQNEDKNKDKNKDKSSYSTIEKIRNASDSEKAILNHIIIKVAEFFNIKEKASDKIGASVLLFGIKPIHELVHPPTIISRKEKMKQELEKLIFYRSKYSTPPSFPNIYEARLLVRINARIEKITNSLLDLEERKLQPLIAIAPPATPTNTPPVTPSATPVTPPISPPALSTAGETAVSVVPQLQLH